MKAATRRFHNQAGFIGIPIEKGVPIVPRRNGPRVPVTDIAIALLRLEVGDSFVVPIERRRRLQCSASSWGRRLGRKFTVRKLDEFARVWRVK